MQVKNVMSPNVEHVPVFTTLVAAARKMRELNCGFLPISDIQGHRVLGVITDRDIVVRGVANSLDPEEATVDLLKSNEVLFCYADDELQTAAKMMEAEHVYRLVVLNSEDERKLCGILSLGDILRHNQDALASEVAHSIMASAA